MPMNDTRQDFHFKTEDETIGFAQSLAERLTVGMPLLLSGPVGAGKSLVARTIIQHLLAKEGRTEDVPSPTFTLVQVYDLTSGEIWHCDLYRLGNPGEAFELGLDEAMENQLCLIEWPDRLGDLMPKQAISLTLKYQGKGRHAQLVVPTGWGQI